MVGRGSGFGGVDQPVGAEGHSDINVTMTVYVHGILRESRRAPSWAWLGRQRRGRRGTSTPQDLIQGIARQVGGLRWKAE